MQIEMSLGLTVNAITKMTDKLDKGHDFFLKKHAWMQKTPLVYSNEHSAPALL